MSKADEARASLPEELRPIFDELVADYRFHCQVQMGSAFFAPKILAALVRGGWRRLDDGGGNFLVERER